MTVDLGLSFIKNPFCENDSKHVLEQPLDDKAGFKSDRI